MRLRSSKRLREPENDVEEKAKKTPLPVPCEQKSDEEIEIDELYTKVPEVANIFTIIKKIKDGANSRVYLARLKNYHHVKELFVLKHILPATHPDYYDRENELRCLKKLGGQDNVIELRLCLRNKDNVVIVMDFFPHDDFDDCISEMSVEETRDYMKNLLTALRHIYQFNVVHQDVRPSNFLYNRQTKSYALVDFGMASEIYLGDGDKENTVEKSQSPPPGLKKSASPSTSSHRGPLSPLGVNSPQTKAVRSCLKQSGTSQDSPGQVKKSVSFNVSRRPENSHYDQSKELPCSCLGKEQTCSLCEDLESQSASSCESSNFCPPEVLLRSEVQGTAVDIWSAGVIFLSILSACHPFFDAADDADYLSQIIILLGSEACIDAARSLGKVMTLSIDLPPKNLRQVCLTLRSSDMSESLATAADALTPTPVCTSPATPTMVSSSKLVATPTSVSNDTLASDTSVSTPTNTLFGKSRFASKSTQDMNITENCRKSTSSSNSTLLITPTSAPTCTPDVTFTTAIPTVISTNISSVSAPTVLPTSTSFLFSTASSFARTTFTCTLISTANTSLTSITTSIFTAATNLTTTSTPMNRSFSESASSINPVQTSASIVTESACAVNTTPTSASSIFTPTSSSVTSPTTTTMITSLSVSAAAFVPTTTCVHLSNSISTETVTPTSTPATISTTSTTSPFTPSSLSPPLSIPAPTLSSTPNLTPKRKICPTPLFTSTCHSTPIPTFFSTPIVDSNATSDSTAASISTSNSVTISFNTSESITTSEAIYISFSPPTTISSPIPPPSTNSTLITPKANLPGPTHSPIHPSTISPCPIHPPTSSPCPIHPPIHPPIHSPIHPPTSSPCPIHPPIHPPIHSPIHPPPSSPCPIQPPIHPPTTPPSIAHPPTSCPVPPPTPSTSTNSTLASFYQLTEVIRSWTVISDNAFDLLRRMLDPNPFTRISAEEALKHPFFAESELIWHPRMT